MKTKNRAQDNIKHIGGAQIRSFRFLNPKEEFYSIGGTEVGGISASSS